MALKEKVLKIIIEAGEENTIKEIAEGVSAKAFFDLKEKFEILQNEINNKQETALNDKLDSFEKDLKE